MRRVEDHTALTRRHDSDWPEGLSRSERRHLKSPFAPRKAYPTKTRTKTTLLRNRLQETGMMVNRTIRPAIAFMLAGGLWAAATANAQVQTPPQSGIINEHLSKSWKDNNLTPAKQATD